MRFWILHLDWGTYLEDNFLQRLSRVGVQGVFDGDSPRLDEFCGALLYVGLQARIIDGFRERSHLQSQLNHAITLRVITGILVSHWRVLAHVAKVDVVDGAGARSLPQ